MDGFSKVLIDIAEKTQPDRAETDYIKDGLMYCGICGEPKQTEVKIGERILKPYVLCKCGREKAKQEEEAEKRELRRQELERNRHSAFMDKECANWTFAKDDRKSPKASDISRRYVQHFETMYQKGKGLLFLGNPGTGKSFFAGCIVNALLDNGYKCKMTNFPAIINDISSLREGKQEYISRLMACDLLAIDDLAIERNTGYANEIVQSVIDTRYRSGKPLIVTTNLTVEEIKHPSTIERERLFSRLYQMCLPIAVVGNDRRKENSASKDEELRELLGIGENNEKNDTH
jgi:DNA replication protein DnaC